MAIRRRGVRIKVSPDSAFFVPSYPLQCLDATAPRSFFFFRCLFFLVYCSMPSSELLILVCPARLTFQISAFAVEGGVCVVCVATTCPLPVAFPLVLSRGGT